MNAEPHADIRRKFIAGMSRAACTVNVVTTDGAAGRAGVTVSAMASVSAETPQPTLLVCVHHLSPAAQKIVDNGVFCVNVLRDDQSFISDSFAGRFKDQLADKFDCAEWVREKTGSPRVVDPLVAFDCRLISNSMVGTHHVLYGGVEDLFIADRGCPLIYSNRAYGVTSPIESAASLSAGVNASRRRLSVGCYHSFGPRILPRIIQRMVATNGAVDLNLVVGDRRRIQEGLFAGEIEVALLYDLELSRDLDFDLVTEVRPYVLLAKDHELAGRSELAPADLSGQSMVLLDSSPSRDYFQNILRRAGIEPRVAYRSTSFEMVRSMVAHQLGYALLGTKPASDTSYDGRALVTRPLIADAEPSRIVLARRKGTILSPVAAEFHAGCCEMSMGSLEREVFSRDIHSAS